MIFKNYKLQLSINIALILLCELVLVIVIEKKLLFFSIFLILLTLYLVFRLFNFFDKTNQKIASLINSVHYKDAQQNIIPDETIKSIMQINQAFENLNQTIQHLKLEKEKQTYYLKYIIQQIKVGILIYDTQSDGKIEYLNEYACQILQIKTISNIIDLQEKNSSFYEILQNLKESKKGFFKTIDTQKHYSVQLSKLIFKNKSLNFIIMHDIKSEMDEQEVESWTKLIRILTHEIMNSLSPITSLSSTIYALVSNEYEPSAETINNLKLAAQTISKRSTGLMTFVDSFRNLIKIPEPNIVEINICKLFARIKKLYSEKILHNSININFYCQYENISVNTDENLLEQCIINLINNAIDAVKDSKIKNIDISAQITIDNTQIKVSDTGSGISQDNLEKIFIPFFTTKTSGNGIGLSLVKQILLKLKADIKINSELEKGTNFFIIIPNP